MAEIDITSRIKDITLKINFHENRIAMHKSSIKKVTKRKIYPDEDEEGA